MKKTYDIHELVPYINWAYFFFAWQVKDQAEKVRLRQEAEMFLTQQEGRYHVYGLFELFEANADGDDIMVFRGKWREVRKATGRRALLGNGKRIPCLRQQQGQPPYLCLSDFISPLHISLTSKLGIFATSADIGLETDFDADPYQKMMAQLLADRLAEN